MKHIKWSHVAMLLIGTGFGFWAGHMFGVEYRPKSFTQCVVKSMKDQPTTKYILPYVKRACVERFVRPVN